eukprot:3536778-Amphidinium_carterae.1
MGNHLSHHGAPRTMSSGGNVKNFLPESPAAFADGRVGAISGTTWSSSTILAQIRANLNPKVKYL